MAEWKLAQINIARLVAPLGDPRISGFVSQLATVNVIAENSTGFRWRLKSGQGDDATDPAFNNDPFMIVNMSVWDSIESLREFTCRSREHMQVFRDRAQWFQKPTAETLSAVWCHAICVLVRNSFRSAC